MIRYAAGRETSETACATASSVRVRGLSFYRHGYAHWNARVTTFALMVCGMCLLLHCGRITRNRRQGEPLGGATEHGSLSAGERVGEFLIERLLGVGGSGEVYCVRDPAGQSIALKLLPRATATRRPDFVQAFQREYHRLQLLRHPRIVEVYHYGSGAHGLYYTMELIEGPDLRSVRPLPWKQTCMVLRDIALSLAIVHSRRLVHRDVSPGNVRLGRDGRAKLIDFGATVTMGIPRDVVGTAPCTPPEAFAYESLDARADLFGLGALGYYLLTAEHAYPASAVARLMSLWEAPLRAPSTRYPEIPKALDRLIASLLQRDRRLRPRSANEVINHLEALADLAPVPSHELAQTSFVTPALAGRAPELHLLCCHVTAARSGRGSALLLEGAPGQGRTRLLRQLVIEASHPDVLMLELNGQPGATARPDACLQLCEGILRHAPELAEQRFGEQQQSLSSVCSELRAHAPLAPLARKQLSAAVCEALFALTRRTTVVLLIDDVHACDEPSAALLAALIERTSEHALVIVATKQIGARVQAAGAMPIIARCASRVLIKPLSARAVEKLVRSAFVDAVQVKFVSEWVFGLSQGNPSKIVELLRHLVEHDLVAFRDGAWSLPEQIDPALLPRDVADALRARVDALTSSARELLQLMAVQVRPASVGELPTLLATADRVEAPASAALDALDELSSADLIAINEGAITIPRPSVREITLQALSAGEVSRAHARVGGALASRFVSERYDRTVDLATAYLWAVSGYHLLLGGEKRRGVRLWLNALRYTYEVDYVPIWDGNAWYCDANMRALEAAQELGLRRSAIIRLRISVLQSSLEPDPRILAACQEMLPELARAAGVEDHASLQLADPVARIVAAMHTARERWVAEPDAERGVDPQSACALLANLCVGLSFTYYLTLAARDAAALPNMLAPFVPIVPSFQAFAQVMESVAAYIAGRTQRELETRRAALSALESPGMRAVMNETMRYHLCGIMLYTIAAVETVRDPRAGLRRIAQMESDSPFMTFGAWQLRLLAHVHECNAVDAQACMERMETASVQDAAVTRQILHASGLQPLAAAYALAEDVLGLQAMIDKLEPFARMLPTWQPFLHAARAHYHMLRGQLELARELAGRAVSAARAGEHRGYGFATLALVRVQLEQQDDVAAHSGAQRALEHTCAHGLGPELEAQLCALDALALARLGHGAQATQRGREALALAESFGLAGLLLGEIHRVLARVAVLERDGAAFERHAVAVAQHTCGHEHPVMLARYKRLLSHASDAGLSYSVERAGAATLQHKSDLRARLLAELDRSSLVRSLPQRVLDLMVEHAGVSAGFLFELEAEALRLRAPDDAEVPAGLVDALQVCLDAERAVAASAEPNTMTATRTSIVRLDDEQLFQVAVLHVMDDDGVMRAAGAIALRVRDALPAIPRWDCVLALSAVLNEGPASRPM